MKFYQISKNWQKHAVCGGSGSGFWVVIFWALDPYFQNDESGSVLRFLKSLNPDCDFCKSLDPDPDFKPRNPKHCCLPRIKTIILSVQEVMTHFI